MDNYIITNDAETLELEAYSKFKLSARKVKSTTWYELEPQRLSFTVEGYGGEPSDTNWQNRATNVYNILVSAMNFPENSYKGISPIRMKLKKNGSVIFTGYISLTQSELDEDRQIADFVCYDALHIVSLMSDEYVPYGTYTLGQFLNNDFYDGSSLSGGWSLSSILQQNGFNDISLSLLSNTINEPVTEYLFDYSIITIQNNNGLLMGFYTYSDSMPGHDRQIDHLFFVIFQVYVTGSRIVKNIKVIEIVNGYCHIDPIYGGYDNFYDNLIIVTYNSNLEAEADIDNQINEEVTGINGVFPDWGDWFSLQNIGNQEIVFNEYSYELINSDPNDLYITIEVIGNIFPTVIFFGDNAKQHTDRVFINQSIVKVYSSSLWISGLKDFLIGNNLVMKATGSGNIEIKSISVQNAIDISESKFIIKKKIQLVSKFTGLGTLDGDTESMINNFEIYYRNYLSLLATYDIVVNHSGIDNIVNNLDVLDTLTDNDMNYLILKLFDNWGKNKYDCECIEVT